MFQYSRSGFIAEGRSPMSVGRRKKEEAVIAMVSAIENVLTVLAVAIVPDHSPVKVSALVEKIHAMEFQWGFSDGS
ncbi:hypothetical protein Q5692_16290 [Microcoleus sp. C2C3]|uniref:hypothetical protein n=1 Tax=unclassified Microcoleus TaxID=2642155 RepID=UPI002FD53651